MPQLSLFESGTHDTMHILLTLILLLIVTPLSAAPALIPSAPKVSASSYYLMDFHSGHVIAEFNADERVEPASLTKMMSAYIVEQEILQGRLDLNDQVRISEKAWRMEGSRMFVEVGKFVTVEALLKGVIIQSGNDATVALAEHIAGSESAFAELMNAHAQRLGMANTHFVNSTGMPDPNHYTTAHDMAILGQALIRDGQEFYSWYAEKSYEYNGISQYNRNKLLWRSKYVDGIKTGHTEAAGYCLVASGEQDGMRLIWVVMGTKSENSRADESQKLLTYGFRFFETHKLYAAQQSLQQVRIWKGGSDQLPVGLADDLYITIPRGQYNNLQAAMQINGKIIAPQQQNNPVGRVVVKLQDSVVAERPLLALESVAEAGLVKSLIDQVKLMFE